LIFKIDFFAHFSKENPFDVKDLWFNANHVLFLPQKKWSWAESVNSVVGAFENERVKV